MPQQGSIDLTQFEDSPAAAELRTGVSRLRFAPGVEAEFRRQHLQRSRTRTRVWSVLTLLFIVPLTITEMFGPAQPDAAALLNWSIVVAIGLLLGWLPWSRQYLSLYLPVAEITTPITCFLTAPYTAQAAADGRHDALILLALQIFGIFQFTGLLFRAALISCMAMLAGFIIGAISSNLPMEAIIRYTVPLCIGITLGAIAFRGIESLSRTQFLEGKLLGQLLESDPLTGLKNRRRFDEHLERMWLQAQRDKRSLAVLMLDVDHFKRFNDLYGHQAGDDALRRVSAVLRESARRPLDLAARYGGEEFALIMHDVTPEHARETAEWLREAVQKLAIPHRGADTHGVVTLSIGIAVAEAALGRTARGVVQLADEALYAAKDAGRNGVRMNSIDVHRTRETGVFVSPFSSGQLDATG